MGFSVPIHQFLFKFRNDFYLRNIALIWSNDIQEPECVYCKKKPSKTMWPTSDKEAYLGLKMNEKSYVLKITNGKISIFNLDLKSNQEGLPLNWIFNIA